MRYVRSCLAILGCFLALVASRAAADVIFSNPITGTDPGQQNPYTTGQTTDPNVTASGIGRGAGVTGEDGDNRYNASSWTGATIDLTQYFTFTITPDSGFEIDFTDFVYTGTASSSGPDEFSFRSSVDGFVGNIGTPTAGGTTISLSGAAFQNITSPIEFRLYGFSASSSNGTFSVNDFTFNGAVAVPEASSFLFAGLIGSVLGLGSVARKVVGKA